MNILSGNSPKAQRNKSSKVNFFEQFVHELHNSIIILTENGIIKTINKATERIFRMKILLVNISFVFLFMLKMYLLFQIQELILMKVSVLKKELTFNKPYSSTIH
jgi:transcriptional regulator with PAS, ATPase and Fis domain